MEGQGILDLVQRNGWSLTARRAYANEGFRIAAARGLKATQDSASPVLENDSSGIYLFSRTD